MAIAAIDRDLMAARDQPGGELFGKSLESSVAGGNAARAEDRDARRYSALAALDLASARAGLGAGVLTGAYRNQLAM